ncbi:TIGR04283 family arsenosugar biosynthesis glycosyltransferase [Synechococcus sp. Tobar12-5m-g]|uniref:TIGR04283 family arsenosugar biosynthesis glycosyltransferase n=1 Tax=unclassified Synechococcus TaxID=2626047 RepID=UPI0020CDD57C|nr:MULTISPECIES: TIGR04283 family arsenosugar biosynthesis glycosyltransferase [unclassified Synechococcus]MCP9771491.1 TIGR04283 family arsenosugar biosynthesis glycosyltransferase [Synechococcus sp. Tobar12-5m-g]MCP9872430.1 TIGR04283 family arsenosugar biosynthesis glycosyltransferase [Synechococcus sp. Cruz CV-v-12]
MLALVSVIIPVLNEAREVGTLLPHWRELRQGGAELIVVDGGSTDATEALIEGGGFAVLSAPRGRAGQMNAGAAAATGELLIFLHADTRLPAGALDLVRQALTGPRCWGRFDVELEGGGRRLRLVSRLMNLRSRLSGIATGDQAIFLKRETFKAVGGFPDQPLMEDIELSARLRRRAAPVCLRAKVRTSSRRWRGHGTCRTIVLMWGLRLAYACGVPSTALACFYR